MRATFNGMMGIVRVVVLADTHGPRRWRVCPQPVAAHLQTADLILHAGDVCTALVLAELAEYAPVVAVIGNNDKPDVADWGATPTAELNLDGLRLAMLHDSGPAAGAREDAQGIPGSRPGGVRPLPHTAR